MQTLPRANLKRSEMRSAKNYFLHGLYFSLYGFVKYLPFPLSNYLRFFVLRIFAKKLESSCIGEGASILFPWRVSIGKRCSLNDDVIIDGTGGVEIGDGVRISPRAIINTADHAFAPGEWIVDQGFTVAGVAIGDDVWIGASAVINKGVVIGRGSVIGAGAVVTKNVPENSIAAGVPCRVIGTRNNG